MDLAISCYSCKVILSPQSPACLALMRYAATEGAIASGFSLFSSQIWDDRLTLGLISKSYRVAKCILMRVARWDVHHLIWCEVMLMDADGILLKKSPKCIISLSLSARHH